MPFTIFTLSPLLHPHFISIRPHVHPAAGRDIGRPERQQHVKTLPILRRVKGAEGDQAETAQGGGGEGGGRVPSGEQGDEAAVFDQYGEAVFGAGQNAQDDFLPEVEALPGFQVGLRRTARGERSNRAGWPSKL